MGTELVKVDSEMIIEGGALAMINRAEIDVQISTAKRYHRQITACKQEAMTLATNDEETAASMFYVVPRGGKKLEGPSIRLAEVVGSCWGNLRYGKRVVDVDRAAGVVVAQGVCHDLEKNVAITVEVRRGIKDKNGRLFNDDMINVTGAAACSIALRNAIFCVIPRVLVDEICDAAKRTAVGDAETMVARRDKMLDWFRKAGSTDEKVFACLGIKGADDIGIEELITLRGMATAIKQGDMKVDDILPADAAPQAGSKIQPSSVRKPAKSDLDALNLPPPVLAKAIAAGVKTAAEFHAAVLAGQKFGRDEGENEALFAESSMQSGG